MQKIFYKLSDGVDVSGVVMTLDGCMQWIEGDQENYELGEGEEPRQYIIEPVLMTDEEFNNLPESDLF